MSENLFPWDDDAAKLLEFMPTFVRPIARGKIEAAAKAAGETKVSAEFMHKNKEKLMGS